MLISTISPGIAMADGVTETAKQVAGAVVDFVVPTAHATVPEPSTIALMAVGGAAAFFIARKKKRER